MEKKQTNINHARENAKKKNSCKEEDKEKNSCRLLLNIYILQVSIKNNSYIFKISWGLTPGPAIFILLINKDI